MIPEDRLTIATPEGVDVALVLAGLGSRFSARLLDSLFQALGFVALAIVTGIVADASSGGASAVLAVGIFSILWLYDVLFEVLGGGRTPGKRITGLRVVMANGAPVTFLAAAIRNTLRILDYACLYIPAVVTVTVTARHQRLGDLAAGTVVVRERQGGAASERSLASHSRQLTVPPANVVTWDVRAITLDELAVIYQFLERRLALPYDARMHLATQLASRFAPKVPGVPADAHPEYILEGIAVAKQR